jgi:hypothetical protein
VSVSVPATGKTRTKVFKLDFTQASRSQSVPSLPAVPPEAHHGSAILDFIPLLDEEPSRSQKASRKKKSPSNMAVSRNAIHILYIRIQPQSLLTSWLAHRQTYAELHLLATETFTTNELCCDSCSLQDCVYDCLECRGPRYSKACLLKDHARQPLHHVQVRSSHTMLDHVILYYI